MTMSKKKADRLKEIEKRDKALKAEQKATMAVANKAKEKADKAEVQAAKKAAEVKAPPKPKTIQRLVAERNIEKYKALGYKVVKCCKDKHNRVLGVNTNTSELTLMEKANK